MQNDIIARFRRSDYVKITIFSFAITALWQSLHTIILPLRLLDFVSESEKNTYLGLLTLTGLLLAMVFQPIAGAISDRSHFRWGRRRPYILIGTIVSLLIIPGVGYVGSYAAIFLIYCLLQLSSNTAQGPYQAFIPELVPKNKHGIASGVKALMEILGGVTLVYISSIFMDRYVAGEASQWLWFAIGILGLVMLAAMVATIIMVKEPSTNGEPARHSVLWTLLHTLKDIRSNRDFIWFLVSRLLVFMAFAAIQKFALYYLRDAIGVSNPAEATARFSIVAVAGMLLVVYPSGYLSDRLGRKPVAIASGLLAALGVAIITLTHEYNIILGAAGIIGVGMGGFNSSNWALATDLVARGEEARYLGIANMATACGSALSGVFGVGIDYFNRIEPVLGYRFMLLACLVCFFLGSVLMLRIKSRR
jgi:Na+/melibiose symporter-like transporter